MVARLKAAAVDDCDPAWTADGFAVVVVTSGSFICTRENGGLSYYTTVRRQVNSEEPNKVVRAVPPNPPHTRWNTFVNHPRQGRVRQSQTPQLVPKVLVMISVVPEPRVGKNPCRVSMVTLVKNPSVIVSNTALLVRPTSVKYAQKQRPSGTNPTMLTIISQQ